MEGSASLSLRLWFGAAFAPRGRDFSQLDGAGRRSRRQSEYAWRL